MLQIVNRRFNRRMLTAHDDKHRVLLAFPVDLRQALLSRQHVVIQKLVETKPVFGLQKPRSKLHQRRSGKRAWVSLIIGWA